MRFSYYLPLLITLFPFTLRAELPTTEEAILTYLTDKGVKIYRDREGTPTRLMSDGKEGLTAGEYALIGQLTTIQQVGINAAPLNEEEWGFLMEMPNLKQLSIWHAKGFADLKPFSGLKVESLTIGGCMGLRDLNRETPERQRDAILTLTDLPNLTRGNWYHSPLIPDDRHLFHIAEQFPGLQDLRLDFKAPRGFETTISPEGLAAFKKLPLKLFSLENADSFTPAHFTSIAGIESLQTLLIDARRGVVPEEGLASFRNARPDVEVVVAGPGEKKPPVPGRKP